MTRSTSTTTAAMMAELSITFPAMRIRPLREFGRDYACAEGVWTYEDVAHVMPDGLPMFCSLSDGGDDFPEYDGTVHIGFTAWLDARGWYAERYDGGTYFLLRDADLPEPPEWSPATPPQRHECPC